MSSEWNQKGATLSDKTARKEFGLTQEEIIDGIRLGKLDYRENHVHGNPYLRLLRREVEAFVSDKRGPNYLKQRRAKTELAQVNRELKSMKEQVRVLEVRKSMLVAQLAE